MPKNKSKKDIVETQVMAEKNLPTTETLDKETEKIRNTVLKVLAKHPDKNQATVFGLDNKDDIKSSKEVYRHENIATLDSKQEESSIINQFFHTKSNKIQVKIKPESSLNLKIKSLNNLLSKKKINPFSEENIEKDSNKKDVKRIDKNNQPDAKFVMNKSGWLLFVLNLVITIVLLGGIILAVIGGAIYKNSFISETAVDSIINIIPYPAGIVNSKVLTIAELRHDVAALNKYFATQVQEENWFGNIPTGVNIQTIVWDKFVQDTLLYQLADKYGLEVTSSMLQQQLDTIIQESGSQENFAARISLLYGWDIVTFTDRVIKPFVLREALSTKIFRDETLRQERVDLVNKLSIELRDYPDHFTELATKYSEDELTRVNQGETGLVSLETLGQILGTAVTSLNVNEISNVIETGEGYEIIQVLEKTSTQINIRRILIRYPTLELLLDQAHTRATIYRFVR